MWVINPGGTLTSIEPDHPAFPDAEKGNNSWRKASVPEIAAWARKQSVDLIRTIRAEADRRVKPEPTEQALLEAVGKFYRDHRFVKPVPKDLKAILLDADRAGALQLGGPEEDLLDLSEGAASNGEAEMAEKPAKAAKA